METQTLNIPLVTKLQVRGQSNQNSAATSGSCCTPKKEATACCSPSQSVEENGGACCAQPKDGSACCDK
jgi:hypothetical protein